MDGAQPRPHISCSCSRPTFPLPAPIPKSLHTVTIFPSQHSVRHRTHPFLLNAPLIEHNCFEVNMRKWIVCVIAGLLAIPAVAQEKEKDRLENSGHVMQEILDIPDGIPHDLLQKAECVLVLPSVKKAAIGIGGNYGRGVMTCRSGANYTGAWGAPAFYALEGGNIGFQLGGE